VFHTPAARLDGPPLPSSRSFTDLHVSGLERSYSPTSYEPQIDPYKLAGLGEKSSKENPRTIQPAGRVLTR
jgi:hypothetical protein